MKYLAEKAPAGRLSDLRNIKKYVSWYLFRLWYMQSEAFRYYKSFEHSPKPSKHQKHKVFNDSNIQKIYFLKNVEEWFWSVLQYVKKIRWIQWWCPFWLKPSKIMSFWRCSFLSFFIFLHFLYILGSAAWQWGSSF